MEQEEMKHTLRYTHSSIEVPMANGNIMKIPVSGNEANMDINISEEMNRSGCWKSLESGNSAETE
jgi:hypothetical protein